MSEPAQPADTTSLKFVCPACGNTRNWSQHTETITKVPGRSQKKRFYQCLACKCWHIVVVTTRRDGPWRIVIELEIVKS